MDDNYEARFEDTDNLSQRIAQVEAKEVTIKTLDSNPHLPRLVFHSYPSSLPLPLLCQQDKGEEEKSWKSDLLIKERLAQASPSLNGLQSNLLRCMHIYNDMLVTIQDHSNAGEIKTAYAIHALNHIYKARDKVTKNSLKIKTAVAENKEIPELRDQGFTKPKVLVILPFKSSALELVKIIMHVSGTDQQDNKKRFLDEFDDTQNVFDDNKPDDYKALFSGNNDDCFRIGLQFSRKQMKIYSGFYKSDMLIASPLGLRMIVGAEGDKERDYDFLSSIEILILDQADTFLMQNWEHVLHIFNHLNLVPKESHDCDFSRIRPYTLDGQAAYLRQTLIFSAYNSPEFNCIHSNYFKNVQGRIKVSQAYSGTLHETVVQVPQLFHRFDAENIVDEPEARFQFFIRKILPSLSQSALLQSQTLIFIPSYFDFVRLRNYFKQHEFSFAKLSEYSSNSEISRSRGEFYHRKVSFLLVSERFHFFRRYRIRGSKNVVFYALPLNSQFYSEFINQMEDTQESTVIALFSKYDRARLERITGSKRVDKMIKGDKDSFMFS